MNANNIKIIECPRDAMQGISEFIPTSKKLNYLNKLLTVGFDTIDAGSFVSPKAIPQMRDTAALFEQLDMSSTNSKLLAIVANKRGADEAVTFNQLTYLGYPLSLSETFQQRNTNRSIDTALNDLIEIQNMCIQRSKQLVVYLSMGFGNPYNDPYNADYLQLFTQKLDALEIGIISLADTIGVSNSDTIKMAFSTLIPQYPHIEFGAHLHSKPQEVEIKLEAALEAGCKRFDGAIKGFGGCPMAKDELVGNMATEKMLDYFSKHKIAIGLDTRAFEEAMTMSEELFH